MDNPVNSTSDYDKLLQCSGLNEDCLVNIFKYLSVCDLLSICNLDTENDKSFTNLINDRVIKTKLFDFDEIQSQRSWSVNKVFENFGQSMKRLKIIITPRAFIHFLRKVITYCQTDHLSELEIITYISFSDESWTMEIDEKLRTEIQPFFRQLQKFTMKSIKSKLLESKFLEYIDFPNLKVLTLENFESNKNWLELFPNQMCSNMREIRLINVRLNESIDIFEEFLHRLINLEVFIHTYGSLGAIPVAEKLIQRFPNLRGFGYSDQYRLDPIRFIVGIDEDLRILRNFNNLREFHLQSDGCKNLHGMLQFWPHINVLSIWQVQHFQHLPVEVRRIFQSLKRIVTERRAYGSLNDHVHLFVNQSQYNEFKAINDIDDIIRMTVVKK